MSTDIRIKTNRITRFLSGKNVCIIGAAPPNIGSGLVEVALANGADMVWVCDIDRAAVQEFAQQLNSQSEYDGLALGRYIDVTNPETVRAVFDEMATFGSIDIVIDLAAIFVIGVWTDVSLEKLLSEMIDLEGAVVVSKVASEYMIPQGFGHIVLTSSMADSAAFAGTGIYPALKAAISMLGRILKQELSGYGIKVSIIMLGFVKSKAFDRVVPEGGVPISVITASFPQNPITNLQSGVAVFNGLSRGAFGIPIPFYVRIMRAAGKILPRLIDYRSRVILDSILKWKKSH